MSSLNVRWGDARRASWTGSLALSMLLVASCAGDGIGLGSSAPPRPDTLASGAIPPGAGGASSDAGSWLPPSGGSDARTGDEAPPVDPPPPSSNVHPACKNKPLPGLRDYPLMIVHQGQPRLALVHIPPDYDATKPYALVFNAHGQTFSAPTQSKMSQLNVAADKRQFITVVPQGTGGLLAGYNCGNAPMKNVYAGVDDVGFVNALIDELKKTLCIDDNQIHCTGFSIGGAFCYRVGCDLSARIASIASVSGPDATESCNPTRPVALLHIHGTNDSFASYYAENDGMNIGATSYVARWAKRLGCSPQQKVTLQKGAVTCKTYDQYCKEQTEAQLCTVQGGTHNWPGGAGWLLGGPINKDIDASAMILDFFRKHPLNKQK